MSNLVELLTGTKMAADLREGTKFFAESEQGESFALASRGGVVALWTSGASPHYLNLQPIKKKNRSEAEIQGIWLSRTGDILFVATSVDIVAVNTYSRTVAWEYQQKRQWGFLVSIPQGGYLNEDDDFTTFYSSGEVVQVDRQSRVLNSAEFGNSPRFVTKSAQSQVVFGSDSHVIWKWDAREGFGSRTMVVKQPCFTISMSHDARRLGVKALNKVIIYDTESVEELYSFSTEAGLPQIAFSPDNEVVAHLAESRVMFRSMDGEIVGVFEVTGEIPISIYGSQNLNSLVIGMRSGTSYLCPWPV